MIEMVHPIDATVFGNQIMFVDKDKDEARKKRDVNKARKAAQFAENRRRVGCDRRR